MSNASGISVRFFAGLRETLNSSGEVLTDPVQPLTVADIREHLLRRGGKWAALGDSSLLVAVNQELADDSSPARPGDEVAFFPPVTGG